MANQKTKATRFEKVCDWLTGLGGFSVSSVLIIIGNIVENYGKAHQECEYVDVIVVIGALLKDLGIATVIAVIIGFLFDKRQKQAFIERTSDILDSFKKDAFLAIYKWRIPDEYLYELQEQVLKARVVRRGYYIEYLLREISPDELTQLPEGFDVSNRLVVDMKIKYTLWNMTPKEIKDHQINCFLEKEDAPDFNVPLGIYITARDESLHKTWDADTLKEKCLVKDEDVVDGDIYLQNKVKINNWYKTGCVTLKPHDKTIYSVEIIARILRSKLHTREVHTSLYLSDGIEVRLKSLVQGLDVYGEIMSPQNLVVRDLNGWRVFKANRPLLPFQGVMIWWHDPAGLCECHQP